ncbi:hypothetical protein G3A43_06750 [Paraburkholderia aspalathi]|nr:hypothetical protein [Paraburkholderia aspalathi]MBK3779949.1 hypothetical protein [Paraburkholderia aspalathi]
MKTVNLFRPAFRPAALAAAVLIAGVLAGCGDIEYRCPLDPSKKPDSPTACAGMADALKGAQRGTGGKLSVLVDDKGRVVPQEMLENRPAQPLAIQGAGSNEPYDASSGEPVFREPKVFKTWSSAFVDANGNLHDGHSAWFATPGRWSYGTVDQPGDGSDGLLKPASPLDNPPGKVVQTAGPGIQSAGRQGPTFMTTTPKQRDQAALKNLSSAANGAARTAQTNQMQGLRQTTQSPSAAGVTEPAISLGQ